MTTFAPPRLDRREHRRLARLLHDAQLAGRAGERLTPRFPELTHADAAEIRDELVSRRIAAGERLVGAKVSVDAGQFEHGWLTDGMVARVGRLPASHEPRLAVVVRWPMSDDVLAAVQAVHPAVEAPPAASIGPVDRLAANLGTREVLVGAPERIDLDAVLEPLLWLAGRCSAGGSRVAAVACTLPRLVLVAPGIAPVYGPGQD